MIRIKTEEIFKHINVDLPGKVSIKDFIEFCNLNNYSFCVLSYNDSGLYLNDGKNYCKLDPLGFILEGNGIFANFVDGNSEGLFKTVNTILNKIDSGEYDIIYVNEPKIEIEL